MALTQQHPPSASIFWANSSPFSWLFTWTIFGRDRDSVLVSSGQLSQWLVLIYPLTPVKIQTYPLAALIPNVRSWLHWLRLGASLHGFISYHVEVPIIECPAKRISGISADDAAHAPHACPRLRGTCSFHGIAVTGDCDQPLPAAGRGDLEPLSRTGLGDPQVLRGTRADVLRSAELPARELATGAPPSCEISQLRLAGHEYGYTYWRVSRIHLDHSVPGPIPYELRLGT